MSDLWDAIEGRSNETDSRKTDFYLVYAGFASQRTKSFEVQATSILEAIEKTKMHFPLATRVMVALKSEQNKPTT
jgi:hypothetical protein